MKKSGLFDYILALVIFEIFFLIGLAFLISQWYWLGLVIIGASLAPLEVYYHQMHD